MVARVLLVDDVAELRAALRQALRLRGGFEVVAEAGNGATAIEAARSHRPDIVVLDLGLPDLAGQDVMTDLRQAAPGARIVVYSGSHVADRAAVVGSADAFIEKSQGVRYLVDLLAGLGQRAERSAMLHLPAEPRAIAVARRFVASRCSDWRCPALVDDAQLVVTELVTNAVVHAGTACQLRVGLSASVLRIEVEDRGAGVPDLQRAGTEDEGGRGLLLVSLLSSAWGAEAVESGKRVWAELPTERAGEPGSEERRGAAAPAADPAPAPSSAARVSREEGAEGGGTPVPFAPEASAAGAAWVPLPQRHAPAFA